MYCNINQSDIFFKLSAELFPADIHTIVFKNDKCTNDIKFKFYEVFWLISKPLQQSFEVRKKVVNVKFFVFT
jgi:hypothetical protein